MMPRINDEFNTDDLTKGQRWYRRHKEYYSKYYKEHRKQTNETMKRWRHNHLIEFNAHAKIANRNWQHNTEKGRIYLEKKRIRDSLKHRQLGTELLVHRPISDNIEMDEHHITIDYVIPIPRKIHKSVPHNVRTAQGMNEINMKVFNYLSGCKK